MAIDQLIPLHAIAQGNGPPVILIHGLAASSLNWQEQIPVLVKAGYRIVAPDLPGHGDSPQPEDLSLYTSQIFSTVLETWIESLQLTSPPILVAHSLGGYVSLCYAIAHPENLRGLFLVAPFYTPRQIYQPLRSLRRQPTIGIQALRLAPEQWLDFALGHLPDTIAGFPPEHRHQIAHDYKRCSPLVMRIAATFEDLTPRLASLHLPVQVVWGDHDITLQPHMFPRLVKSLPNATGHPIPACGHQPHVSKADQFNALLLDFLHHLEPQR
ncbi:MAG: alpha/beta hydrolase [Anaerolineales bacterium]|nr:alpha/beta hydrolase [Anaerolineales bacterium]